MSGSWKWRDSVRGGLARMEGHLLELEVNEMGAREIKDSTTREESGGN